MAIAINYTQRVEVLIDTSLPQARPQCITYHTRYLELLLFIVQTYTKYEYKYE